MSRVVDQVLFKDEGEEDGERFGRIWLVDSQEEERALRQLGRDPQPGIAVGVPFGFHDRGEHGVVEVWGTRKQAEALGRFFGVEVSEA
jgi:hypothetical protein